MQTLIIKFLRKHLGIMNHNVFTVKYKNISAFGKLVSFYSVIQGSEFDKTEGAMCLVYFYATDDQYEFILNKRLEICGQPKDNIEEHLSQQKFLIESRGGTFLAMDKWKDF